MIGLVCDGRPMWWAVRLCIPPTDTSVSTSGRAPRSTRSPVPAGGTARGIIKSFPVTFLIAIAEPPADTGPVTTSKSTPMTVIVIFLDGGRCLVVIANLAGIPRLIRRVSWIVPVCRWIGWASDNLGRCCGRRWWWRMCLNRGRFYLRIDRLS